MSRWSPLARKVYEGLGGVRVERIRRRPQAVREADRVIKLYNTAKGYGFVALESGRDAYFGQRAIAAAPRAIERGARVRVRYVQGERSLVVSEFLEIEPRPRRAVTGTIKFYRPLEGFGFVEADDGGSDVYLNARTLARSGLEAPKSGEPVEADVIATDRGRYAHRMTLLAEA